MLIYNTVEKYLKGTMEIGNPPLSPFKKVGVKDSSEVRVAAGFSLRL
jgi:hypothetical protein